MEKIAIYDMAYRRAITLIFLMNILVNEIYTRHYSFKNSKQRKRRGKFVTFVFLLKKGLLTSNFFQCCLKCCCKMVRVNAHFVKKIRVENLFILFLYTKQNL